jgi:hypothetical protein
VFFSNPASTRRERMAVRMMKTKTATTKQRAQPERRGYGGWSDALVLHEGCVSLLHFLFPCFNRVDGFNRVCVGRLDVYLCLLLLAYQSCRIFLHAVASCCCHWRWSCCMSIRGWRRKSI